MQFYLSTCIIAYNSTNIPTSITLLFISLETISKYLKNHTHIIEHRHASIESIKNRQKTKCPAELDTQKRVENKMQKLMTAVTIRYLWNLGATK